MTPDPATALRVDAVDVRVLPSRLEHGLALARMRLEGPRGLPAVRIDAGALSGYGEAPPLPTFTGLDADATARGVARAGERIVGLGLHDALARVHAAPRLPGPVRCALDVALHDLLAKARGVPLHTSLARPARTASVPISRALGFHPPDALAQLVDGYLRRGVRAFKVKVGRDLASDLEAIETVRRTAGDACEIALDANESLERDAAVALARAAQDLDVAYFEQPVVRNDLDGLRAVREAGTRVMADESAFDARDVIQLHQADAIDLVAIKLIKCGGIAPALEMVRAGAERGLDVTVIDPLGSAVSLHAGLAVAVAIEPHAHAHGLSAGFDVDAPHAPHVGPSAGRLAPADAPGLGVHVAWPDDGREAA